MPAGETVSRTNEHDPSEIYADNSAVDFTTYYNNRIHFHSFFELEFFVDGEGSYEINSTKFQIKPGLLCLTSPADYHTYRIPENGSVNYYCLQFFPKYIDENLSSFFYASTEPIVLYFEGEEAEFFRTYCQWCVKVYNEKKYMYARQLGNLMENLCIEIMRRKQKRTSQVSGYSAVKKAIIYAKENYAKNITLKEASALTGLSEAYFSHIFATATGIGFSSYVKKVRLTTAADLIKSTDLTFKEICYMTGFKNTNYFTDSFRKEFGCSPGTFRKK